MSRTLIYRPNALDDLNEAEGYTRRTWGDGQARRYVAALVADIKALQMSALRYPLYDNVHSSLRRALKIERQQTCQDFVVRHRDRIVRPAVSPSHGGIQRRMRIGEDRKSTRLNSSHRP